MNKKFVVTIAVFIALLGGSCKKFLTIQPQFEFTSTLATSTLDGLTKTAIGGFNQLQSGNLYGGGIIANSELLADFVLPNTAKISDFNLLQLINRQMNSYNALSGGMWGDAYRAIYISNVVLKYAPNFASQNPAQVNLIKGQAYFIRGIMHFELLRMFAQPSGFTSDDSHLGIPIVLTPGDITHGQNTPRSTVKQCYAQIEADLDSAYILLPPANSAIASQGAAAAFLARVYFTQHQYQTAKTWADNVAKYNYQPNDSVGSIYNITGFTFTNETIFQQISYIGSSNSSTTNTQNVKDISNAALTGNYSYGLYRPALYATSDTFHLYYAADSAANGLRAAELYKWEPVTFTSKTLFTNKYQDANMNVTVIRFAEILLTRAECEAQLGMDAAAQADLNQVRVRAGLLPNTTTTGPALIQAIRTERDYELAYEGDRLYEIKRRQISFSAPENPSLRYAWNSPNLVYPIPLQELQENPNMIQNPGY